MAANSVIEIECNHDCIHVPWYLFGHIRQVNASRFGPFPAGTLKFNGFQTDREYSFDGRMKSDCILRFSVSYIGWNRAMGPDGNPRMIVNRSGKPPHPPEDFRRFVPGCEAIFSGGNIRKISFGTR